MKQKLIFLVFLILSTTSLLSFFVYKQYNKKNIEIRKSTIEQNIEEETKMPKPPKPYEETLLSQMTPEEKVGQLFMFGVEGNTALTQTVFNRF